MSVRNASLMPSFRRMASLMVCSLASRTAFLRAFFAAELVSSRTTGFEVSVISVCPGKQSSYRHYVTTFAELPVAPRRMTDRRKTLPRRLVGRVEENVAVDADVESVADRHLDRGLNIQVAPCDIGPQLRNLGADGACGCFARRWVAKHGPAPRLRKLKRRAEHARQQPEPNQALVVVVHIMPKPGVPASILPDHAVQVNATR